MKKQLCLSSPVVPTPAIQRKSKHKSSPRAPTRQPRTRANPSPATCQIASILVIQASQPTKEAIPPAINPWQRINEHTEPVPLGSIIEREEVAQSSSEEEIEESREVKDAVMTNLKAILRKSAKELENSSDWEGQPGIHLQEEQVDDLQNLEVQHVSDMFSCQETLKPVEEDLEETESSSSGTRTFSTNSDVAADALSETNNCSDEAENADDLETTPQDVEVEDQTTIKDHAVLETTPKEVEAQTTIKDDAATASPPKGNETPKSKSWSDIVEETEEEEQEALDKIKKRLEDLEAERRKGIATNSVSSPKNDD